MNSATMKDVFLGRFVKAFGIRGELKFHPSEDFWEETLSSEQLWVEVETEDDVDRRPISFESTRPHGKRSYVVRVQGIDDRNTAEELIGGALFIAEDEIDIDMPAHPLPFQIIGASVRSEAGEVLGTVKSVLQSAAHDVYEIQGEGGDFLVPAVPEFIVGFDREKNEIVLRPMPGLIGD
jgi:16S rRNA processing protein RimM